VAKLKYDVTDVEEFAPYAGPTPKRGIYDCVVRSVEFAPSSNGNDMFTFMVVIESSKKDQKVFNGCPLWQTWVIGDLSEEYQKRNLKALIKALGLREKGQLDTDAIIKKGEGMKLRVIVKNETRDDELVAKANGLLPFKAGEEASEDGEEVEEPDEEEAEEDEAEEDAESEEDEFDSMTRAQLRKHIKDNSLGITVRQAMSDDEVREAIRAASAEDEEEPEEDEEEEEDEAEESSVEEDIAELDRTGLKGYIKENELEVKVTKSMSDDDIRKAILAAWPDEEEGDEEDGDEPPF
jgi:hypothetical protein